jgi:hypothetical protein
MRKIFIITFLLLVLVSCNITELPFEHKYVINMVLKPYETYQRIFVDSTYRLDVPIDGPSGIEDADIFVIDENSDTFRFVESDTIGLYYSIDSLWTNYGMTYFVNVVIQNDTITEEVNVPDTLKILLPVDGDTVSLSNPPELCWNKCEGCFNNTYVIVAYITEMFDSLRYNFASVDTVLGLFKARDLFREVDTFYTIGVMGFDENSYYAGKGGYDYDVIDDERAIGLIGTVVYDSIVVWVTE